MGSCAAPSAKGDDKFITTDYLQQCPLIRYQDGSASGLMVASRVGDFQLSVPHLSEFDDPMKVDLSSATIEPIRLVFCGSTRHVYDAIVEEIAPQSDGTCQVTAKEYLESFYAYDDATYPGDVA